MERASETQNEKANPFDPGYWESGDLAGFGFRSVGKDVRIAKNCTIVGLWNVSLGNYVRIDGPTVLAAASGSLSLGDHIHIGGFCFLGCAGGVEMEDFSGLSQGVRLYSASDDYTGSFLTNPTVPEKYLGVRAAPVRLGRHAIIGAGGVILPGVTIGEGAAVGALSLVAESLDPWGVYAGVPARFLKARAKDLLRREGELRAEEE